MNRSDYWRLTIHFWPRSAEANVRPQPSEYFSFDDAPATYRPHDIDFDHPPTREDLLGVVTQTPWMHGWESTMLPVIAINQWPMIDAGHKAASVDLLDNSGKIVGCLKVRREHRFHNVPYSVPMIGTYPGCEIDKFLKRRVRDKAQREQARQHVELHRNLILERMAQRAKDSQMQMLEEVEAVLIESGHIKAKRHRSCRLAVM